MTGRIARAITIALLGGAVSFAAQSTYDPEVHTWTLNNGWIRTVFQLDGSGSFLTREIDDLRSGDRWVESANRISGPIRMTAGDQVFTSDSQYELVDQFQQSLPAAGIRQIIVVRELGG